LILLSGLAQAAGPRYRAVSSAERIGLEDTVVLDVTIEGADATGAELVERPSSPNFRLVGGPNVSTQFRFVNGEASLTKTLSFTFLPLTAGRLNLPAVNLRVGGQMVTTAPVPIEVVPGSLAPSNRSGRSSADPLAPFGALEDAEAPADPGEDVILRLETPVTRVYPGQPVPLDLILYYRVRVGGADLEKEGKFDAFWVETVDLDPRDPGRVGRRELNGRPYNTQVLRRWVLFPLRAGQFDLEPWTLRILVEASSRSFFGMPRRQVVLRRTNPVSVEVMDFPEAGRPPGFSGFCGRIVLEAELGKAEVSTGEGTNLRLTIRGDGNLRSIPDLKLADIPGCKVYAPKLRDEIRLSGGTLRGSRTWEHVVVPLEAGRFTIPAARVAYFDPQARAYRTLTTPNLTLSAAGERVAGGTAGISGGSSVPLELKGRDIQHIRMGPELDRRPAERAYRQPLFWAVFGMIFVGMMIAVIFDERRRRLRRDLRRWARSRAAQEARRRLRRCTKLGRAGFSTDFLAALSRLLEDYVRARFGVSTIELTGVRLRQLLAEKGISESTIEDLLSLLQVCESYRYVPAAVKASDPDELLRQVDELIRSIEGERP
jgi:hypothetical protein